MWAWGRVDTHVNVLGPEEELPAKVGELHMVHVGNGHAPTAPSPQAHQGKAFEQLAADSASTHLPAGRSNLSQRARPHPPKEALLSFPLCSSSLTSFLSLRALDHPLGSCVVL